MSLFNRLKSSRKVYSSDNYAKNYFGRCIGLGKRDIESFNEAQALFADGRVNESIYLCLKYIDQSFENIHFKAPVKKNIVKDFELYHATRKVDGFIDNNSFEAICRIGDIEKDNAGLYRLLLQNNSLHLYSTYVIDNNEILLKFCSSLKNLTAKKLYKGLEELALKGDKMAQFLPVEFEEVRCVDDYDVLSEDGKIKKIKTEYLLKWTNDILSFLNEHDIQKDIRIISCYLFAYVYRVDFLLVPYYRLWVLFDKMISAYHRKDRPSKENFSEIKSYLVQVEDMDYDELSSCFARPELLFDMPRSAAQKEITGFLKMQINDAMNISRTYGKDKAVIVFEHAAGFCFYNFLMNPALNRLLFLFMQVMHPGFFKKIGSKKLMADIDTRKPVQKNIEEEIEAIISEERTAYPYLRFFSNMLKYHSLFDFAYSFFNELIWLNFKKPDG